MTDLNVIYNEDCISGMGRIPDSSIDAIITDPPYKYLKAKFDRDFDEDAFFEQANRVLKPDGWIILFGRGTSFYRWNTRLAEMGFSFKEEICWDKCFVNSPVSSLSRIHETISLSTKGKGKIRRVKVPYMEKRVCDLEHIIMDIRRLKGILNNQEALARVLYYVENGKMKDMRSVYSTGLTVQSRLPRAFQDVSVIQAMAEGMVESSIIRVQAKHKGYVHPTEKPVRLLERLMNLVIEENGGGIVLDPFSGSGSTAIAAKNLGHDFIAFEIDQEYWKSSISRLQQMEGTEKE